MNYRNDINERLARMSMATGLLDPGHYYLVASGQIPFEVYRNLQKQRQDCRFKSIRGEKMKKAFTVYYREEDGEIVPIKTTPEFRKSSALLRADVLLDAINDLIGAYNSTLKGGTPCQASTASTRPTHQRPRRQPGISP